MVAGTTDSGEDAGRTNHDEVTDGRIVARMLEMRAQGYSFRDIAAAVAKQEFITLSPERVRDILDTRPALKRKT